MTRPTWMTWMRMTSSWYNYGISMHSWHAMSSTSQLTCHQCRSRQPRLQAANWAKPIGAELSCKLKVMIQCSWSYVQPDLRLNMGCSSGHNCFEQILFVRNAIWMILDLFPANLIIPDVMVWFDYWDLDRKWWWWINKRDFLMKRHLKVIVVVDGDEEKEEVAYVCLITCVEFVSEEF